MTNYTDEQIMSAFYKSEIHKWYGHWEKYHMLLSSLPDIPNEELFIIEKVGTKFFVYNWNDANLREQEKFRIYQESCIEKEIPMQKLRDITHYGRSKLIANIVENDGKIPNDKLTLAAITIKY